MNEQSLYPAYYLDEHNLIRALMEDGSKGLVSRHPATGEVMLISDGHYCIYGEHELPDEDNEEIDVIIRPNLVDKETIASNIKLISKLNGGIAN